MARVNKKEMVKQLTGTNPVDKQSIAMNRGGDDVKAKVQTSQGDVPAALKEGEVVFSIPSIIAAGNGDYEKGLQVVTGLHDKLKAAGEQMLQSQSIAGA